jgi:alginate O-acetyltransferase complex protein AlgI
MTCAALFNTYCFLFGFLPVALLGYWLVPNRTWKLAWIVAMGLVFYSLWDVRFVALLVVAAIVDFVLALRIETSARHKRRWLTASIVFNLGVLAVFKYSVFAAHNARALFDLLGVPIAIPYFSIILPIGISFFTFKAMSYTIDVYRGKLPATRNLLKYAAFITLFPELVAGPIVRWEKLTDQFDRIPRRPHWGMFATGLTLFAIGLFKKVIIADSIARYSDPFWASTGSLTTVQAWIAALGFTLQLYFDFSGYSDMAIGLGAMLGFRFPINFRAPYHALNPSDFWRRWHITLSTWLRDYLYISLGGNRGSAGRVHVNLLLVMLLGGLWHGANWTFVAWGAYHGLLLVVYRETSDAWDNTPAWMQRAAMLLLAIVGWVFFRAPDIPTTLTVLRAMFAATGAAGLLVVVPVTALLVGFAARLVVNSWRTLGPAYPEGWQLFGLVAPLLGVALVSWAALSGAWTGGLSGAGLTLLALLLLILLFTTLAPPTADMQLRFTTGRAIILALVFTTALVFLNYGEKPFLYYQF